MAGACIAHMRGSSLRCGWPACRSGETYGLVLTQMAVSADFVMLRSARRPSALYTFQIATAAVVPAADVSY